MSLPRFVPWISPQEVDQLKQWFYQFNSEEDNRRKAIFKVQSYSNKQRIPHAMEVTAIITSVILSDNHPKSSVDEIPLQMSYSMSLIRFVNGLLDSQQKSQFAIPLTTLAKNINLPVQFVELRHSATHEDLPSLTMLRRMSASALGWLYENYWSSDDKSIHNDDTEDVDNDIVDLETDEKSLKISSDNIKEILRKWRRLRRDDPNKFFKKGDQSEEAKEYWSILDQLKQYINNGDETLIINVLLFKNVLVPKKSFKINQYAVLYGPIFTELNQSSSFVENFVLYSIKKIKQWCIDDKWFCDSEDDTKYLDISNGNRNNDAINTSIEEVVVEEEWSFRSEQQVRGIIEWIKQFLTLKSKPRSKSKSKLKSKSKSYSTQIIWLKDINKIIDECALFPSEWCLDILKHIQEQEIHQSKDLSLIIENMKKYKYEWRPDIKKCESRNEEESKKRPCDINISNLEKELGSIRKKLRISSKLEDNAQIISNEVVNSTNINSLKTMEASSKLKQFSIFQGEWIPTLFATVP